MGHSKTMLAIATILLLFGARKVANADGPVDVAKALKLLEDRTKGMALKDNKEIILILGNAGSGKAEFSSFVTGKLDELKSVETSENSGEFLISAATGNSISSPVMRPESLFPELFLDENGVKWYNIPSFMETRNITAEIATTFFTKSLIDSAEFIKLVFVVNHASLQTDSDRSDFMNLVRDASKLLKRIDRYKLSISLIVTKVKDFKKINGQCQLTPEDIVIRSIGNYLSIFVKEWKASDVQDSLTVKSTEFVEALLQSPEDGVYPRIGIFRCPTQAGLLSQIPLMVHERASVRKVILENIVFTKTLPHDFGHTLSEMYRGQVVDLAQRISQNITDTVTKLGDDIKQHFEHMSADTNDFNDVLRELSRAEEILLQLKENAKGMRVKELLTRIINVGDELEIPFVNEDLKNIVDQQKYLEFLEIISVKGLPVSSNDWIAALNSCFDYVTEGKKWLLFLIDMQEQMSSYDVQSDVTRYNVENLTHWGERDQPQGIYIDSDNFGIFLEKQRNYELVRGLAPSSKHCNMVNTVLKSTVSDTVEKKCVDCDGPNCKLTVKGQFVRTSDVDPNYCKKQIRILNVFALNTIFVDKDLVLVGENLEATFIAPKWNVIGKERREIAVHGSNGPDRTGKARSGTTTSPNGQPGEPGLPGFNGGKMLAISQKFENYGDLMLSADGGQGGKGQGGGDAVVDLKGCGGKGGGGGAGGLPGNPGLLKVIPIDHKADIYAIPWKKEQGFPGANGVSPKHTRNDEWECENNLLQELKNNKDQVTPEPQSKKAPVSGYIEYKQFVRESLINSVQKTELLHFVNRMEMNEDILAQYEIKDLIADLESMESHFLKLHLDLDFVPFYQDFEPRILNFTQLPENKALTDPHKIVLNYLYSATYSKICSLKANDESNLVIDILGYLNLIKERIQHVSKIGKEQVINQYKGEYVKEVDAKITEANDLIKTEIDPEFDNIYSVIDDKIGELVTDTIQLQKDKKTELEEYKRQKKELQRNMGLRMMLGSFKAVGQIVSFMGPYGAAAGSAINVGTSIGEGFVRDPDVKKEPFKMPDGVSTALDNIGEVLKHRKEQKSKAIDNEIQLLEEEIKKDPEVKKTLEDTLTDITKLKEDIKKEKEAKTPDQSKIESLEEKLPELIKERQKQLKEKSDKPSKVVERSLKVMTVTKNALEVVNSGIDMYHQFNEDREKINQVGDMISEAEDDLQALVDYEKNIYATFLPMMHGMRDDMQNVEKNLDGRSHVSLDVTKWKVQSHLKDLKNKMASFTKGFTVQEELTECIDKLNFALTTIINIYDRIQSYQDQQKLAVYIANINSPFIQSIQVHGEYRQSVLKLELLIQSNIVMQLFNNVVSSFKQHVFPFARQFLDTYKVPKVLQVVDENDINILKTNAVTQIDEIRRKMLTNLTTIREIDTIVLNGEFDYEGQYLKPFYTWEYKEHSDVIDNLLSGKEVFLRADIKRGVDFNAIKFRTININFKVKDPAINAQLQQDLQKFGIILTHLGSSYYKCDSNFYIISTQSIPIEFSIATGSSSSTAYEKLKSGNILLSPYTSWKVKLIPGLQADPKKLEAYKKMVDLELIGSGQYVKNNVDVCQIHSLEKFYKMDKTTIHETDGIDGKVLFEASPPSSEGYLNLDEINYLF